MKFNQTTYTNKNEILKFADHYVSIPVMVDDAGITANTDGKKLVLAGTIVGGTGGANSVLLNDTVKVSSHNIQAGATSTAGAGVDAEGVLMDDVDVTYGPASGAMLIHGFINIVKLPVAPSVDAISALKSRILFLK
ncbi:hypothetical protein [Clostridium estertheticum]|uniref:hypothetical protein n=1 Tax=Clostridium estertheticum TaxID=238834 RepID=UPI00209B7578|nr:hypothetical protein [Clostridium estertheticum]